MNIATLRLQNQRLVGPEFTKSQDVVAYNGAVQAQDYLGAKWAIGQRIPNSTDADIDKAFNDGEILRTHILRPTWHFVTPKDIKWIQDLTAPRVDAFCRTYYKKLNLDDATFKKADAVLAKALAGGVSLTRAEVKEALKNGGVDVTGLRPTFLIMRAEIRALVCSGPKRGKQHTLALLEERAPQAITMSRDESLAELTKRYFVSHGPAQMQDFAWWSSLPTTDVKQGIEMLGAFLAKEELGGKTFYFVPTKEVAFTQPTLHLLPNYDECLVAYKDHNPTTDPVVKGVSVTARTMLFANHLVVRDGLVIGGWRREQRKNGVAITVKLAKDLTKKELQGLDATVARLQDFLQTKVTLAIEIVQT